MPQKLLNDASGSIAKKSGCESVAENVRRNSSPDRGYRSFSDNESDLAGVDGVVGDTAWESESAIVGAATGR